MSEPKPPEAKSQCWCEGMGEEISNLLRRMGPSEEVQGHFRSARIEMMKGLRAMLDEKIDKAQRAQQAQRGSTVTVD